MSRARAASSTNCERTCRIWRCTRQYGQNRLSHQDLEQIIASHDPQLGATTPVPHHREHRAVEARTPSGWSLRFQLLASVQVAMILMLSVALYLDHYRELQFVLSERQVSLAEEADTLVLAIATAFASDVSLVQSMLDRFGRHPDQSANRHQIFIKIGDQVLMPASQSDAAHDSLLNHHVLKNSSADSFEYDQREMVIAIQSAEGIEAYVVEPISAIRHEVLRESLLRILALVAAGVIASVLIDFILWRAFIRPVEKLAKTVESIASGELGAQVERFHTRELETLGCAINRMSATLNEYDRGRRRELDKARRLQQHLQSTWPAVSGLKIDRFYLPATDVTGDYQDLVKQSDKTCSVCLADVTGHGVPAAMSAAMLKVLFQHASATFRPANELLHELNSEFGDVVLSGDFASVFIMCYSAEQSSFNYSSAGHLPGLLLRRDGQLEQLDSTGIVIGALPDAKWTLVTVPVVAGDRLLLVTDGVTEMFGPSKTMFGLERLIEVFRDSREHSQSDVLPRIRSVLEQHRSNIPVADDMTIVAIEFE